MFIPGIVITVLTFPGVMVHEFAHKLACHWTGTPVIKVCYFRFDNPAGYVIHEEPDNIWKHILIGIGPFFVNTFLGLLLSLALGLTAQLPGESLNGLFIIGSWLALSIAMHAFPSVGDAMSIWSAVWQKGTPIAAKLVGTPLVGIIFLGAFGSVFWLDLIYGMFVVFGLPSILRSILFS
ncbi:MAG: metalloprotease family protein [Synechococcales bacterium]|nr:metalloprotease family protein [Synechococcales bacterium]